MVSGRFALFPYREEEEARTGGSQSRVLRPTLDVLVGNQDLEWRMKCLVDTGAPGCVFPRGAADALDIDLESLPQSERTTVHLVGQSWMAGHHVVDLQLPDLPGFSWEASVRFLYEDWPMPFAIVGHEGFLDRWAVSFNAYLSYFVVEPSDQFDERLPVDAFNAFQERYPDDYSPPGQY